MFFGLGGFWGQPLGPNFRSPWATMLALRLDCSSTAALTTHQKVLPIWKLIELKMLDFSDCSRTGISILTSATDPCMVLWGHIFFIKVITSPVCHRVKKAPRRVWTKATLHEWHVVGCLDANNSKQLHVEPWCAIRWSKITDHWQEDDN